MPLNLPQKEPDGRVSLGKGKRATLAANCVLCRISAPFSQIVTFKKVRNRPIIKDASVLYAIWRAI